MKFIRYRQGKPEYTGVLEGNTIRRISGSVFHEFCLTSEKIPLEEAEILPPILPGKIVGLRKNYEKNEKAPMIFIKPSTSVISAGKDIIVPKTINRAMAEGELALIIGKKCRHVKEEDAGSFILGYTIANDITGISDTFADTATSSKAFDTFSPLGPFINNFQDWWNREIKTFINGRLEQSGSTSGMFFKVPYILAYLSSIMTLMPGDVILTGTPSPSVRIFPGDRVKIEIDGLGFLENGVKEG